MRYFLFLLFASVLSPAFSQDYTPMLAEVNEWHLTYCYLGDCSEDVYFTDGEMEVLGNNYRVLDGYHYISREFLLREEVEEKKVYLATIIGGNFREYLLYDFSLSVGDEFDMLNPVTPFPINGGLFTLTDIQSLPLADGELYRHFYFSPSAGNTISTWDAIWVEGVGSLSIPNAPGGSPIANGVGRVSCAFRDGAVFYTDFELVEECSPTILAIDSHEFELFITTSQERLTIESSQKIRSYQLIDTTGKVLINAIVDQLNETSFETSHLNDGVYFLKIKGEGFLNIKKVMIH